MTEPWQHVDSTYVHENPFYKVRKDNVIRPDGKPGIYHVIELKGSVIVFAITDENKIVLEHCYRYPTKNWGWETPAGGLDPGEEPLAAAKRELLEETGYKAENWEQIGITQPANSILANNHYIYVCTGLTKTTQANNDEEGISEVRAFTMDQVKQMVVDGRIIDETTLGPLLVAMASGRLPA